MFLDSAVEGLAYATSTQSGVTAASGEFVYKDGESVTFRLYDTLLDAAKAAPIVTPGDLKEIPDAHYTLNLIKVLLAADVDGNPDNGIQLAKAASGETWNFNLNQTTTAFDNDPTFKAFAAKYSRYVNSMGIANSIPTAGEAASHFNSTVHNALRKQQGAEAVFPVVGRKLSYSVKSDFCTNKDTWYGNATVTMSKTGFKIAGAWSNLTTLLNSYSAAAVSNMTCSTLSNAVPDSTKEYAYGMFASPGVIAYKNVGNNTLEDMLNDMADFAYLDVNGNRGIMWPQYEFQTGSDVYGRKYIDMFWRRNDTLWHSRTYYGEGTDATHGKEFGTISERYVFQ
ncbi:MAG: hypothetical protein QM803_09900 [Rhodocyclaceae bacterium]